MRHVAVVFLISIYLSHSAAAQEKNTDALVCGLSQAIRNNDTATFLKLFITYSQFKSLVFESLVRDHDSAYALKSMPHLTAH